MQRPLSAERRGPMKAGDLVWWRRAHASHEWAARVAWVTRDQVTIEVEMVPSGRIVRRSVPPQRLRLRQVTDGEPGPEQP